MKTWKEIFKQAKKEGWAVGHFNISNLETLQAIVNAAKVLNSPVMIGVSEGERNFIGSKEALYLVQAFEEDSGLPIILNADHHKSFEAAKEVIDFGFKSLLFDGSALSFEENLKTTKEVVEYTKSKNPDILVEGELGYLRGRSEIIKEKIEIKPEDLTQPDEAWQFASETGVDRLGIAVGNIHGISFDEPKIDFERIKTISQKMPESLTLVLHGGSGIADEDLKTAIAAGIRNVHINTELRRAYVASLRESLYASPEETVPYKIFPPVIEAIGKIVEKKLTTFGSVNKI